MPNRGAGGVSYRYGFNGKETENDVKGIGNEQDYGMRIYDPRLGRFLSVDPLQKKYPYFSHYQFSGNQPIWATDLDGLEPHYRTGIKHIPSQYDNSAMEGTIGDYTGLLSGYAIEYERKTYVIYENIHGTRQWYVEYDKDGWKGSPTEFRWYNPADDRSFDYLMLGLLSTPFVAMGIIEGGVALTPMMKEQALNLAVRGFTAYKKILPYLPTLGALGSKAIDLLDESGVPSAPSATVSFFKNPVFEKIGKWVVSNLEFTGKSGNIRILEFGGELVKECKNLIINSASYIKGLSNKEAKGELGREGLNALKEELKKFGKAEGCERVILRYQRSEGSSSKNPGSVGEIIININE